MRRARVDDNQPTIVKAFRDLGWIVAHTHMVGGGFPDLVCSKAGMMVLIEIKDGAKTPSQRRLTPPELEFHSTWQGPLYVIESVDDVYQLHRSLFLQ